MTRFSRIHPYPAMIADELAADLAQQFTTPGMRVLDPFCGTGRTILAAAERGAECVGVDINPLATFLARAKSSNARISRLEKFIDGISDCGIGDHAESVKALECGRKVRWFPKKSKLQLSALIDRINAAKLETRELLFVGAILSATAREVSFCRQDGWKLHRITQDLRKRFAPSAFDVFTRRFNSAVGELRITKHLSLRPRILSGDARFLSSALRLAKEGKRFDVVITSPPYGDSRTTVQYGAMSGLCLGVLQHIDGFKFNPLQGGEIDARCLGGAALDRKRSQRSRGFCTSKYWNGGAKNSVRPVVERYLLDLDSSCNEISKSLKKDGIAIFVISRRLVGGWRLNLDRFLIESFLRKKLSFEGKTVRKIEGKLVPNFINKLGRNVKKAKLSDRVSTMREEQVLVFRRI
jgi:site-specific DNA-methyltransferase (cytosine-N4-specific)